MRAIGINLVAIFRVLRKLAPKIDIFCMELFYDIDIIYMCNQYTYVVARHLLSIPTNFEVSIICFDGDIACDRIRTLLTDGCAICCNHTTHSVFDGKGCFFA
jgi:hypothetical protein